MPERNVLSRRRLTGRGERQLPGAVRRIRASTRAGLTVWALTGQSAAEAG
jgi:hypothetical protein